MNKHEQTRASLQADVSRLRERFQSYDGGDRPMSPPAALMQELFDAEAALAAHRPCAPCGGTGRVPCDRDGNECQSRDCRLCSSCRGTGSAATVLP